MKSWHLTCVAVLGLANVVRAGHSAPSYIDGGQSADGRFVVTAEPTGKQPQGPFQWKFTWKDTRTGESRLLDLKEISTGQIYGHIFVAPDGETFAVWNPLSYHSSGKTKRIAAEVDRAAPEWKTREEFTRRLLIYRKTGELVKEFGVNDFVKPEEWPATLAVFERIEWLKEYEGMVFKKTPRAGYSMYRVSPDYSVLEFTIKPTRDDKAKAGRTVRVSLSNGQIIDPKDWPSETARVPVRPFLGPGDVSTMTTAVKEGYVPSFDPVRNEGKFPP